MRTRQEEVSKFRFAASVGPILQAAVAAPVEAAAPAPSIVPVTERLHRASQGNWNTVFLVTTEGIVLADPLTVEFAAWLKPQLEARFDVPVRYVVYSHRHRHWDHAEGGSVFAPTATFVAHEGMLRNMDGRVPHMPDGFVDRNDNHAFERDEVRDRPTCPEYCGVCRSSFFARLDADRDGRATPTEYHAQIRRPDIVCSQRMTLVLGGQRVELVHPGRSHANDGTVLHFPAERAAFSSDFPAEALVTTTMRALPAGFGNFDGHPLREWIQSYREIESLDFDVLLQGHGSRHCDRSDVVAGRQYLEDLVREVEAGIASVFTPEGERIELFDDRQATNIGFDAAPGRAVGPSGRHNAALAAPIVTHHMHFNLPEDQVVPARDGYVTTFGAVPGKRWRYEAADLPGMNLNFSTAPQQLAPPRGRVLDHIGFEVNGLEAFCRTLAANGIVFDRPYEELPSGLASAFFTDPWGAYIELTEGP